MFEQTNTALASTLDILAKNLVLMRVLPHLQDTWMAPHEQYEGMLCSSSVVFVYDGFMATKSFYWVEIPLSTPVRASTGMVLSRKWMIFQVGVKYAFKVHTQALSS